MPWQISRNGHAGCELRATSFERTKPLPACCFLDKLDWLNLLNQRGKHTLNFIRLLSKQTVHGFRQQIQIVREQQVILQFCRRTARDVQKTRQFSIRLASGALRDVRRR